MKIRGLGKNLITGTLLICLGTPLALADVREFQLYRSPSPLPQKQGDSGLSCADLDRELARLSPYTRHYRPDTNKDFYSGTAILIGTTTFWPAYIFNGIKYVGDVQEERRILKASHRMESLRRLKAEKFCYESRG